MPTVIQKWVCDLSFMQQSVLLTCIRGCDGLPKRHVSKFVLRWLRRCIMLSAFDGVALTDPHDQRGGNFTGPIPKNTVLSDLFQQYLDDVDGVPHHFHLHLMHAAEVIGYKHPDRLTRGEWKSFYEKLARDAHLHPETEQQLDYRLGDSQQQWQEVGGEVLVDREKINPDPGHIRHGL